MPVGGSVPGMRVDDDEELVGPVRRLASIGFTEDGLRVGSEKPRHLRLL